MALSTMLGADIKGDFAPKAHEKIGFSRLRSRISVQIWTVGSLKCAIFPPPPLVKSPKMPRGGGNDVFENNHPRSRKL